MGLEISPAHLHVCAWQVCGVGINFRADKTGALVVKTLVGRGESLVDRWQHVPPVHPPSLCPSFSRFLSPTPSLQLHLSYSISPFLSLTHTLPRSLSPSFRSSLCRSWCFPTCATSQNGVHPCEQISASHCPLVLFAPSSWPNAAAIIAACQHRRVSRGAEHATDDMCKPFLDATTSVRSACTLSDAAPVSGPAHESGLLQAGDIRDPPPFPLFRLREPCRESWLD